MSPKTFNLIIALFLFVDEDVLTVQFFIREMEEYSFNKAVLDIGSRQKSKSFVLVDHQTEGGKVFELATVTDGSKSPLDFHSDINLKFFKFMIQKIEVCIFLFVCSILQSVLE